MNFVIVTFDVVGHHAWPGAPQEVHYLRAQHRHVFKFRVEVEVTHADRDVEFHKLKREMERLLHTLSLFETDFDCVRELNFGERSCEQIASDLGHAYIGKRKGTPCLRAIECWEDGENGARVEFA